MNIFAVDEDPVIAAKSLCNAHVRKMFLESCNILLFPCKELGLKLPNTKEGNEIRLSHRNHPATVWALNNYTNYMWLFVHTEGLMNECRKRYKQKYYTENYLDFVSQNLINIQSKYFKGLGSRTPFARCFSNFKDALANIDNTVEAYRMFYFWDKGDFATWPSLDTIPSWWPKNEVFVDKSFKDGDYIKR